MSDITGGKEDLLMALSEAVLMEKGTKMFYEEAAAKSINPEARKTFEHLSEWEGRHMDFIMYLYRSIHGDLDLMTYEKFAKEAEAPMSEAPVVERYNCRIIFTVAFCPLLTGTSPGIFLQGAINLYGCALFVQ